jgi:hypothetical protein
VARVNRLAAEAVLSTGLMFHALRHTYASLCVAAGIPPLQLGRFMGHAKLTTMLVIYTHLFDDDHAETMVALEAMSQPTAAPTLLRVQSAALTCVPLRCGPCHDPVRTAELVSGECCATGTLASREWQCRLFGPGHSDGELQD